MPVRNVAATTNRGHDEPANFRGNKEPTKEERELQKQIEREDALSLPHQRRIREVYDSDKVQMAVAAVIFLNFITSAVNSQIIPKEGSTEATVFFIFEIIFAVLFGIELLWNMYGSFFFRFFKSGWNWFDFIIVIIAILGLMMRNLPGISVLRLFRAFRVFRLFKRIKSLKQIIEGVVASIPGVSNGFLVLLIVMGIWSIMGTEFYGDVMPQEFGTFWRSMLSMWQVMSGDSWSSGIARAVMYEMPSEDNYDRGYKMPMAQIYFYSYIGISSIIMLNVILAIFFEKYLESTEEGSDHTVNTPDFDKASREQLLLLLTEVLDEDNLKDLETDDLEDLADVVCTHSETAFKILFPKEEKTRQKTLPTSPRPPRRATTIILKPNTRHNADKKVRNAEIKEQLTETTPNTFKGTNIRIS